MGSRPPARILDKDPGQQWTHVDTSRNGSKLKPLLFPRTGSNIGTGANSRTARGMPYRSDLIIQQSFDYLHSVTVF